MGHVRHHRPSLIGGLFSGNLKNKSTCIYPSFLSIKNFLGASDLTSKTNQLASEIQMKLIRSQRNSVSSVGDRRVTDEATTADDSSTVKSTTLKGILKTKNIIYGGKRSYIYHIPTLLFFICVRFIHVTYSTLSFISKMCRTKVLTHVLINVVFL